QFREREPVGRRAGRRDPARHASQSPLQLYDRRSRRRAMNERILAGKVAVITGGSRGIGRVTAELCAAAGASIAICGRTRETLGRAAAELRERHRIDVLVNNAGESSQREVNGVSWPVNAVDSVSQPLPKGRFEAITDDEWRAA